MSLSDNTTALQSLLAAVEELPTQSTVKLQEKSVEPTTSVQTVVPDSGYDGLSKVTVAAAQGGTVQSTKGTITAGKTINCGFKPDLVSIRVPEAGEDGWFHPAAAFHEIAMDEVVLQAEIMDGFYYFSLTRTNTGFTCNWISFFGFDWNGGEDTGEYPFTAIKYT